MQLSIAVATLDNEHWSPVQFRILTDTGSGPAVVFSETVKRPERNRWLAREVDLSRWVGQKLYLMFQTRVRSADSAGAVTDTLVPLWAARS